MADAFPCRFTGQKQSAFEAREMIRSATLRLLSVLSSLLSSNPP